MRDGRVVKVLKVGAGGLRVVLADGIEIRHPPGAVVQVPLDALIQGEHTVLIKRLKIPREAK